MTIAPRPGMIRFEGATAFFMAICETCDVALPFDTDANRMKWAVGHNSSSGHGITFAIDIRPAQPNREEIVQIFRSLQPPTAGYHPQEIYATIEKPPPATTPKKLNSRERRRLRRQDKQRSV